MVMPTIINMIHFIADDGYDDDDHDHDMVDVVDIKSKEVGSIGEDTEEVCGSGIGGDSSCKDRSLEKICKLEGLRCVETKFDTMM